MIKNFDDFINEAAVFPNVSLSTLFEETTKMMNFISQSNDNREDELYYKLLNTKIEIIFSEAQDDEEGKSLEKTTAYKLFGYMFAKFDFDLDLNTEKIILKIFKENFDKGYHSYNEETLLFFVSVVGHELIHEKQFHNSFQPKLNKPEPDRKSFIERLVLSQAELEKKLISKSDKDFGEIDQIVYMKDDDEISAFAWTYMISLFYYLGKKDLRDILVNGKEAATAIYHRIHGENAKKTIANYRRLVRVLNIKQRKTFLRHCYEYFKIFSQYE